MDYLAYDIRCLHEALQRYCLNGISTREAVFSPGATGLLLLDFMAVQHAINLGKCADRHRRWIISALDCCQGYMHFRLLCHCVIGINDKAMPDCSRQAQAFGNMGEREDSSMNAEPAGDLPLSCVT